MTAQGRHSSPSSLQKLTWWWVESLNAKNKKCLSQTVRQTSDTLCSIFNLFHHNLLWWLALIFSILWNGNTKLVNAVLVIQSKLSPFLNFAAVSFKVYSWPRVTAGYKWSSVSLRMPFGWTIPSTVFPRKAKMSSRGIANVVRVSMTFSLFQASQK